MITTSSLPQRLSQRRRGFLVFLLIVILTAITACQPAITVLQPAPAVSPLPAATVAPASRGLSVIAVDFDPPLDAAQILSSGGVSLIVAVSNSGQQTEHGVLVTAELQDVDGRGTGVDLLKETVSVKSIEPGAVEVVRFAQVSELPVRHSYKLVVHVSPAPGETDLEDNMRVYEILVD